MPVLLKLQGITKRFAGVCANDAIDLEIAAGAIHALLGENGAGKSTLVKIIYGLLQADEGSIFWRGKRVVVASPLQARSLGVGMVFQHFSLFEALSAAENIALSLNKKIPITTISQRAKTIADRYHLPINPHAIVGDLSVGERQRIEIIRALMQAPDLLVLDEPTSVLTPQEADHLFATLHKLKADGTAILYISHRLDEVRRLCDTATILRHGKVVAHTNPKEETTASLAQCMVGSAIGQVRKSVHHTKETPVLQLDHLSQRSNNPYGVDLKHITLTLHHGEIIGVAGVAGNGQNELFECISGERLCAADQIRFQGHPCGHLGINARRRHGIGFAPEERLDHAAVASMTLTDNLLLSRHKTDDTLIGWFDTIKIEAAKRMTAAIIARVDVRKTMTDPPAGALSGGNLQKFLMGRELDRQPWVLVVNQPTWGVDAGAAALIRQWLIELAESGAAVLLISQDLDELFAVCDCIAVIHNGQLGPPTAVAECTAESLGLQMGGVGLSSHQESNHATAC